MSNAKSFEIWKLATEHKAYNGKYEIKKEKDTTIAT